MHRIICGFSFFWLGACSGAAQEGLVPPPPTPEARLEALEATLDDAVVAWEMDDPEVAQALVLAAYEDHFEPLEAALAKADTVGTLRLEYAFGALRLAIKPEGSRTGSDKPDVRGHAAVLVAEVSEAVDIAVAQGLVF